MQNGKVAKMQLQKSIIIIAAIVLAFFFAAVQAYAATVEYDLIIDEQKLNFTGKPVRAMTINGGIPGSVLRFREGDVARISVHNRMKVETSIHWHGLLVPNDMDGVPYVTFPPIAPGTVFIYEFPLRQNGTYWYHSHTSLQEQSGIYGGIVIDPHHDAIKSDRDYVVLLSDWTDEDPHEVLRTLKRGSEWYAVRKNSGQSILGAAYLGMLGDYFTRELQRMPAMDISDVAYDLFLANGRPAVSLPAEPGEMVRVRIIDGSSTTYFHLEFSGGPMTVVSADGQDVEPFREQRFLIGVAETYDVIVRVPGSGSYELRATAHDGSGHASVWIGSGTRFPAPAVPRPNLYHAMGGISLKRLFSLTPAGVMGMSDRDVENGVFDRPGMMGMGSMETGHMHGARYDTHMPGMSGAGSHHLPDAAGTVHNTGAALHHDGHGIGQMEHADAGTTGTTHIGKSDRTRCIMHWLLSGDTASSGDLAHDGMDSGRPWPPYEKLRATRNTAFSGEKPVRELRLTLDGDMERYVWFLNNRPLAESDSILIHQGEVVRFIMINRTMMHHPMHLHGHFFRVLNGQGDFSPLKHTVDVAPMSTTVIEFDAEEPGDWFFHCHLLYHMKSGMARVLHYDGFAMNPDLAAVRPVLYKDAWYIWGEAHLLSNMTEGMLVLSNTRNILSAEWEAGWQTVEDTGWESIVIWDRYLNRFLKVFAGADLEGVGNALEDVRAVFGIRYLLPLNIESRLWVDSDSGARIALEKHLELTPRLMLFGEAEYDTRDFWEGKAGLSYSVNKQISLLLQWHSEYRLGGGISISF